VISVLAPPACGLFLDWNILAEQGKSILPPRPLVELLSEEQPSSCSSFLPQSLQSIQENEILQVEGLSAEAWRFNLF